MESLLHELVGKKVLYRTMGACFLGRLVALDLWNLKLENCCWLADPDTTGGEDGWLENVLKNGLPATADVQRFADPYYAFRSPGEGVTEWRYDLP